MRTTVRIDDDLMRSLKEQAHMQGISLNQLLNQSLRRGLETRASAKRPRPYREKVFKMGPPRLNLDKALAIAAALEDEEIVRKMSLRK